MLRASSWSSLLSLAVLAAPGASNAFGQNLLFNGNLDQTYAQVIIDNPDPNPDFLLPKPLGWVNEGSRLLTGPYEDELDSQPWAGPAPTPVTTDASGLASPNGVGSGLDAGVFFKPFSGNLTNGPATGHLYQDVPAVPGQAYQLTGWAGAELNFLAAGAEIALEFLDAGNGVIPLSGQVINLMPTLFVDNGQPFDYKQYTASAVAPAGTVSARARVSMLGGTANPQGGGQAFVADDFELTAVPEPASAGLLAAGFAALATRRRRPH
jgi:hypothetical protein